MKPERPQSGDKPSGTYEDLAKAHIRSHGTIGPDGKRMGVVLYGPGHKDHKHEQWQAWMAYFGWLDSQTKRRGNKVTAWSKLPVITVPAEWPRDLDASAPPLPPFLPPPQPVSPERRKQLATMLRSILLTSTAVHAPKTYGFERPRSPDEEAESRAYHNARLEELRREYANTPVDLSDEARFP